MVFNCINYDGGMCSFNSEKCYVEKLPEKYHKWQIEECTARKVTERINSSVEKSLLATQPLNIKDNKRV